jgi:hypothetical protein
VAPAPRRGADGGRCRGRRIRPTPTAAAGSPRSASGPAPPGEPCPPTAARRHWPAAHRTGVVSTLSPRRQDGVERGGELGVPIADRNRNRPARSSRAMSRLPACWVTHSPTGCAVTPSTWTWRVAASITTSTSRRLSNTVSTVKQVHRQHTPGLGAEELPPGQGRPLGGRSNPGTVEDDPDGAGPDPVAQAAQLAMDAAISPGRVLSCQPQHQSTHLCCHGRTATPPRVVQRRRTRSRCQRRSVVGCTSNPRRTGRGSRRASPASTARSAPSHRGRGSWRRSTVTSCRNISSSASLVAERRASSTSQVASGRVV